MNIEDFVGHDPRNTAFVAEQQDRLRTRKDFQDTLWIPRYLIRSRDPDKVSRHLHVLIEKAKTNTPRHCMPLTGGGKTKFSCRSIKTVDPNLDEIRLAC